MNPNRHSSFNRSALHEPSKRGCITEFSSKARRRLMRDLGTMKLDSDAYTMALTLPGGDVSAFSHSFVMNAFATLFRRLSSTKRFSGVSGFWKRELQKRGVIHYHLLLYGLHDDRLRSEFHSWVVSQWVSLFAPSLSCKQCEHHRWWHSKAENMQLVRDFAAYFSKYLGKDGGSGGLCGKWWGKFNKSALPVAVRSEESVSVFVAVRLHRLARKWRQKKMDEGKSKAVSQRLDEFGKFMNYSPSDLWRIRSGRDLDGVVNPRCARFLLDCYRHACKSSGVSSGKFRFRGKAPLTSSMVLCGESAPRFASAALSWVNRSLGLSLALQAVPSPLDFVPNRLKPVPPGRQIQLPISGVSKAPSVRLVQGESSDSSVRRNSGGSSRDALPKWERL